MPSQSAETTKEEMVKALQNKIHALSHNKMKTDVPLFRVQDNVPSIVFSDFLLHPLTLIMAIDSRQIRPVLCFLNSV